MTGISRDKNAQSELKFQLKQSQYKANKKIIPPITSTFILF